MQETSWKRMRWRGPVSRGVRKPQAGWFAGGEDGDAGGLDGGGEVHGTGIVAEEEAGAFEYGGGLAGGEEAA